MAIGFDRESTSQTGGECRLYVDDTRVLTALFVCQYKALQDAQNAAVNKSAKLTSEKEALEQVCAGPVA